MKHQHDHKFLVGRSTKTISLVENALEHNYEEWCDDSQSQITRFYEAQLSTGLL